MLMINNKKKKLRNLILNIQIDLLICIIETINFLIFKKNYNNKKKGFSILKFFPNRYLEK